MKLTKIFSGALLIAAMALSISACKSGPKDADIEKAVKEKLAASPDMASTAVSVKDGVVTLSGECKDDACKAGCEAAAKDVKGVKSVTNNCTVKPAEVAPPPASTATTTADPKLQDAVKAIIKDIPGIALKGFSEKGAILEGTISTANNLKLKQAMAAAKILLDAAQSKITVK